MYGVILDRKRGSVKGGAMGSSVCPIVVFSNELVMVETAWQISPKIVRFVNRSAEEWTLSDDS